MFDCSLIKMARYGNEKEGFTLDPDNEVVVWNKRIEANGIMKAITKLDSLHKSFELLKGNIDKLNPNHYRCYVSNDSNYYNDITGFDERENEELSIGMVTVEVFEVRIDKDGNEFHNYGYEKEAQWY